MAFSYIPTVEADFVTWVGNFSDMITANPTSYGLSTGDANALDSMTTTYVDAYNLAKAGGTRGPATIAAKDAARANVTQRSRQLATILQANPMITNDQKTGLGITLRKTNRTPVTAPTSSPLLAFIAATPLQHTLRFSDQMTPAKRTKPFNVTQLTLSVEIVVMGTSPTGLATQTLAITKNPAAVNFISANVGKMAYYTARWQTRTGLQGPISNTLSAAII